ncbi:MAG: trypsin-like peptidase domain-containing protein, partial [Anaerolineae bacterium]|nr:trypsin-like peptidase domain-containing protein [Anaerolineae bacterium]
MPPPLEVLPMVFGRYVSEGQKLLKDPAEGRFLDHLNRHGDRFPEGRAKLTEGYETQQEALAQKALANNRLDEALFRFRNAQATGLVADEAIQRFRTGLLEKLDRAGRGATAKSLRLDDGPNADLFEAMPVDDYFKYLVEVRVLVRYYHGAAEMERTTHPGATGTGFIVDGRHVLTAYHVVAGVLATNARGHDARIYLGNRVVTNGRVIGWDNITDLALIELPVEVPAPSNAWKCFGDSRSLTRGYEVFGLGNPFGYRSTLTRGIISSLDRKGSEGGAWIQFDAAQAPGSSGGLLVGKDGLIYGLLVAGVEGSALNFAVPSRSILGALDRLAAKEKPGKAWLGMVLERSLKYPDRVVIGSIFPVSPLAPLEVRPQALLIEIGGQPIRSIEAAQQILSGLEPGNAVSLLISNTEPRLLTNAPVDPA